MPASLPFVQTMFLPLAVAARQTLAPPTLDVLRHPPVAARSVWISDLHLGTRRCQAEALVGFLEHIAPERLYLNGDILDLWKLGALQITKLGRAAGHRNYAPAQLTVMKKLLRLHDKGTEITFIPGNHDEIARDWHGLHLGRFAIKNEVVHQGADGRPWLVMHGDLYDQLVRHHRKLSILGTHAGEFVARVSLGIEKMRRHRRVNYALEKIGLSSHWSLAHAIHDRVDGMNYTAAFEQTMRRDIGRRNDEREKAGKPPLAGVIIGHLHIPDRRTLTTPQGQPFEYLNSGDWVDSRHCTALIEDQRGNIKLARWDGQQGIVLPWQPPSRPLATAPAPSIINPG